MSKTTRERVQECVKQVAAEFGTTNTMKAFYGKGGAVASGPINLKYFYGKSNSITATGGSKVSITGYNVHYFYSSGTFSITNGTGVVEYVVVGGGGSSTSGSTGGADGNSGGGGGGQGGRQRDRWRRRSCCEL